MKLLQIGVIFLTLFSSNVAWSQTISVVTEDSRPLQYMKDQKIVGTGTELVETVLKQAGLTYCIHMYPWAKAYMLAKKEKNVLIYSLARTPQREKQFKWVGEIVPLHFSLFRLKSRPNVAPTSLEEAKHFQIGVIRQDVLHQYLEGVGFPNLQVVTTDKQNLKKLLANRVDLILCNEQMLLFACRNINVDYDLFEPVLPLHKISTGLYMAFSKQTDDAIVEKAIKAYNQVKQEGIYDAIMGKTFHGEE